MQLITSACKDGVYRIQARNFSADQLISSFLKVS